MKVTQLKLSIFIRNGELPKTKRWSASPTHADVWLTDNDWILL